MKNAECGKGNMINIFKRGSLAVWVMFFVYAAGNISAAEQQDHPNHSTTSSGHGDMQMQGGDAPADARDPDQYANGMTLESGPYVLPGPRQLRLADEHRFGALIIDRLEQVAAKEGNFSAYDVTGWYGTDYSRMWLKSEGHYAHERFEETSSELLYGKAIASFWDMQVGGRYDTAETFNRFWLSLGVQGLAPYWFEVSAHAYLGEGGRTAIKMHAEYEMLFTQRLILQPRIEVSAYGQEDAEMGRGAGLSEASAGMRLRYEFSRRFAPYLGIEWQGQFGGTADLSRQTGKSVADTHYVAGLRFWF